MNPDRRNFIRMSTMGSCALTFTSLSAWAGEMKIARDDPNRFQIGIQEYTFHRWLGNQLEHLDYPALVKRELGITHIEYWNRPFNGRHTDQAYVAELASRTTGEGMNNVLILVDADHQLDDSAEAERLMALDEHKAWVDCAHQLGCDALRVNCRSGGDKQQNLANAVEGVGRLCDYAADSGVKVVIEPHGGHSADPMWLLAAMKHLDHPHAGLLPDFNNFGDHDRYEAVTKTLPYAPAVCAKALDFDAHGNETNTDYFRMLKLIYESDYSGVISIEYEGELDPIEGSKMTKALIQKALDAARA